MASKVMLLSASIEDETRTGYNVHYPLGLAYLHGYLENSGHIVKSLYLNDMDYNKCFEVAIEAIHTFQPLVLGFQIFSNNRVCSFLLLEFIHENYPNISIVVGGIHTTVMFEQIVQKYPFVTAVIGEGEITLSELVLCIEEKKRLADVKGIAYFENGKVIQTLERDLVEDLDRLPFPKHNAFLSKEGTFACLLTSRGCPFKCSFCVLNSTSRRKVRLRSVANIIAEVEYLVANFPNLDTAWIHDDSFFLDNKRVIQFCDEIVARKIRLKFICSGRLKPISKEMVRAMERAGFSEVLMGLETGSAELLKRCHKGVTPEDAINAYKLFADSSIRPAAFVIVGLPGENESTIMETAQLVQQLQQIRYTHYGDDRGILWIYPGTEVYDISKEKGFITDEYWMTSGQVPFFTVEHSLEELYKLKDLLQNHISVARLFTSEGFRCQKHLLHDIIKYAFRFKLGIMKPVIDVVISAALRLFANDKLGIDVSKEVYDDLVGKGSTNIVTIAEGKFPNAYVSNEVLSLDALRIRIIEEAYKLGWSNITDLVEKEVAKDIQAIIDNNCDN